MGRGDLPRVVDTRSDYRVNGEFLNSVDCTIQPSLIDSGSGGGEGIPGIGLHEITRIAIVKYGGGGACLDCFGYMMRNLV